MLRVKYQVHDRFMYKVCHRLDYRIQMPTHNKISDFISARVGQVSQVQMRVGHHAYQEILVPMNWGDR